MRLLKVNFTCFQRWLQSGISKKKDQKLLNIN